MEIMDFLRSRYHPFSRRPEVACKRSIEATIAKAGSRNAAESPRSPSLKSKTRLLPLTISSVAVLASQPPASFKARTRHTPAVPLKAKNSLNSPCTCCSTSKWYDMLIDWKRVSRFWCAFAYVHRACDVEGRESYRRAEDGVVWNHDSSYDLGHR